MKLIFEGFRRYDLNSAMKIVLDLKTAQQHVTTRVEINTYEKLLTREYQKAINPNKWRKL
ncbi:hypothetical protein LCGC14_2660290 [marine sediment metagenome]|uniref:Uncharacterized protein n=1 Tax=marine sediment metagenome TaxID=412755 RepID=A0A0F8ZS43_9ZZZZ